jgi:hypothetical protein
MERTVTYTSFRPKVRKKRIPVEIASPFALFKMKNANKTN